MLSARGLRPQRDQVRIVQAQFGDDAGLIGAAALAAHGALRLTAVMRNSCQSVFLTRRCGLWITEKKSRAEPQQPRANRR